jgi:hypothetical protein
LLDLDKKDFRDYSFDSDILREIKAKADIIIEKIILDKLAPTAMLRDKKGRVALINSSMTEWQHSF